MEDGLLSLKWNYHKGTFLQVLSTLRSNAAYTDATLVCDGKFYSVHRFIIAACSDYFKEIFQQITSPSPVVVLKDISLCDLESLLDYMYLGKVDIKQDDLGRLIKAAEYLQIKGLAAPDSDTYLKKNAQSPKRLLQEDNIYTSQKKIKHEVCTDSAIDTDNLPSIESLQLEFSDIQQTNDRSVNANDATIVKTDPNHEAVNPADMVYLKDVKLESSPIFFSEKNTQKLENAYIGYGAKHDPGPSIIPDDDINNMRTEDQSHDSVFGDNAHQQTDSMPGQRRLGVIYQCLYCIKIFRDKSKWTTHSRTHTGEKPFQCPYCGYRASIKANVNRHIANIHYSSES